LRKSFVGLIILLIIVGNTFLAVMYADDRFDLPLWLQEMFGKFEVAYSSLVVNDNATGDMSSEAESINTQIAPLNLNASASANSVHVKAKTPTPLHNELAVVGGACAKGRFGAKQQDKSFYVWTDSTGIRHISDKPPQISSKVPISIIGSYPPAQFITRFIGTPMSVNFQDKLNQRLDRLAKEFAQVLDVTTVREIGLNFRFFTQQAAFERYKKRVAPTTPTRSGFYLHAENEMTILVNDEKTGLNTSIHEAVHAINRAVFGSMAKWLNEGLAQVLTLKTADVAASHLKRSLSLNKLFNATDEDWDGPLRSPLYQSSEAFIESLMETQQGRETIARLLLAEQVNGCNDLNIVDVSRILGKL
jgi:hypothetical protein